MRSLGVLTAVFLIVLGMFSVRNFLFSRIPQAQTVSEKEKASPAVPSKAKDIAFLNRWNEHDFMSRVHPKLMREIPEEDLRRLFREIGKRLGPMKHYEITEAPFNFLTRSIQQREHYRVEAQFAYGKATIEVGTAKHQNREWIVSFSVDSPELRPVIDAAHKSLNDGRLDYARFYGEVRRA